MKQDIAKTPEALRERLQEYSGRPVLGLDLGTNCGYAVAYRQGSDPPLSLTRGDRVILGQLDLSIGTWDSGAVRIIRLRQFLDVVQPLAVFFEDVKFTPDSNLAALGVNAVLARAASTIEFFGALKSHVQHWCETNGIPCEAVPIGVIKKRMTGKGNANKTMVIEGVNEYLGIQLSTEDYESSGVDNSADAFGAMLVGLETYSQGIGHGEGQSD